MCFGAEVGDEQREKITAEPSLWLDTSPAASGPGQRLHPESALPGLLGEDDIVGHGTGTRGCCPHSRRDAMARSRSLAFVFPLPLPPRPDVLDLLVDFSISLANDIIGISIVFLVFLLPCAFGDLSVMPGLPLFPLSITAAAFGFWESSPQLPRSRTGQLGITSFSSLLSVFPAESQLSVRDAAFPADVCLVYLAVNSLFRFTRGN